LDKPSLKKIIIIAGPNGAGKTTFARDFLPAEAQTLRFINADLIAAGLAPFNPESVAIKAGRLMLQEIDACVAAGSRQQLCIRNYSFGSWLSAQNRHLAGARVPSQIMVLVATQR
jgi:hypothetical protein